MLNVENENMTLLLAGTYKINNYSSLFNAEGAFRFALQLHVAKHINVHVVLKNTGFENLYAEWHPTGYFFPLNSQILKCSP